MFPRPFPRAHAQSEKNGLVHEIETIQARPEFQVSVVEASMSADLDIGDLSKHIASAMHVGHLGMRLLWRLSTNYLHACVLTLQVSR